MESRLFFMPRDLRGEGCKVVALLVERVGEEESRMEKAGKVESRKEKAGTEVVEE